MLFSNILTMFNSAVRILSYYHLNNITFRIIFSWKKIKTEKLQGKLYVLVDRITLKSNSFMLKNQYNAQ